MNSARVAASLPPEKITAVIDTRERHPLDLSPLRSIRRALTTGDYSVRGLEHVIALERKSLTDLVQCIAQQRGRFEREIRRLLAYPVRALVVEATWSELESGRWRSRLEPAAAVGSCLGWIASGLRRHGERPRAGRTLRGSSARDRGAAKMARGPQLRCRNSGAEFACG